MSFEFSLEQKQALQRIFDWMRKPEGAYLTLGGYAGTGKTTLLAGLRKILKKAAPKMKIGFVAYTGKASRVLENTLQLHEARFPTDSVSTIHSLIYAPIVEKSGGIIGWKRKEQLRVDLIIIDEASMVTKAIWDDLQEFGLPILAIGDHGQLPPVEGTFNLMERPAIRLETIHRQAAGNPIIALSLQARQHGTIPIGRFGQGVRKLNRFDADTGQEIEQLLQYSRDDQLILTGFNKTRVLLNKQMRVNLYRESEAPSAGDRIICLKNNWEKGIYNGMTGVIKRIFPYISHETQHTLYEVELSLEEDSKLYSGIILADQFNQPTTLKDEVKLPFAVDLFDYGYCLTVHKAQGSQARRVLLFEERSPKMSDETWRRWLYTGITRAEEELVIIGT